MRSSSGSHDRRGFGWILNLLMAGMVLSLVVVILYSWKLGLALLTASCSAFIALELVSAPPDNNPDNFRLWMRRQDRRRPIVLCLGDGLMHGKCSSDITPSIQAQIALLLNIVPPMPDAIFPDPIWVVNAGQNGLSSQTILNERLPKAMSCYPDYIIIMIGSMDILAMCSSMAAQSIRTMNDLTTTPTLESLERNWQLIMQFIHQSSPQVQIGLCTLPPIGENLQSDINKKIRRLNEAVERAVTAVDTNSRISVINIFDPFEDILEKKRGKNRDIVSMLPLDLWWMAALPAIYVMSMVLGRNTVSSLFGMELMVDGLHLNDRGRDIVVKAIVDWLVEKNIAKAIAVKS